MNWKISVYEENCTGCRTCQMICSWANHGGFIPSRSHIIIENTDEKDAHFSVEFADGCKNCGLCAAYCAAKALVREKR